MNSTNHSEVFQTAQDAKDLHIPSAPLQSHMRQNYSQQSPRARNSARNSYTNNVPQQPHSARVSSARAPRKNFVFPRRRDPESELLLHEKSDQIQRVSTKVLLGEPITEDDPSLLGLVAVDLQNRRVRLEEKGMFKESLHVQDCIEKVRAAQLEASKIEAQRYAKMDIDLRKGHTNTDTNIYQHTYEAEATQIEVRFATLERELLQRQQKELDEHEELWQSEPKNRIYTHVSSNLRNLRDMQVKLVKAKRYDEAAVVEAEADALEQKEGNKMLEMREADYERSLAALEKKHQDELAMLESTKQSKLILLKKMTDNGRQALDNRKRALKFNEDIINDKEKLWKLKHRNDQYKLRMTSDQNVKKSRDLEIQPRVSLKLPPLVSKNPKVNTSNYM